MKPIGILHMRGGLGNQLFQLSAFSIYCRELGFLPVIYDFDLTLSSRDDNFPQYRFFEFQNLFSNSTKPVTLNRLQTFLVRQIIRLISSRNVMNEKRLMEILLEKRKLPHIFIVRDTFEVDCYVLEIGKDAIRNALTSEALPFSKTYFGVAIHIRIAGYNKLKSHEKVNLFSLLKHLMNQGCRSIDIFTDNIHELSRELIFPPDLKTVWPEILSPLSPPELLLKLSQYDYLITNGSSIARWANYLACSTSQQVFVNLTR